MKCPACGCAEVKEIIYGYLPFDMARKKENGEIVYGGLFMPDDAKTWQCARCGRQW